MEKTTRRLYFFSEWTMNLFLLQVYWIVGVIAGGILFGLVPSSIALFAIIRRKLLGKETTDVLESFRLEYKKNFKNSLFLTLWYTISFTIIAVYFYFLKATVNSWLAYFHLFFYGILSLLIVLNLVLIPVYIHYIIPLRDLIPTTVTIVMTNLKWNIPLLLSLIAVGLIFLKYPIAFLFFGVSFPALLILYICMKAFNEFDKKRESA